MDEELEDFDDEIELPAPKRGNKWMVIGAVFELFHDLCEAFAAFFDALTDEALAKYRFQRTQEDFVQQASREIEMITSGEHSATTRQAGPSLGSGASES